MTQLCKSFEWYLSVNNCSSVETDVLKRIKGLHNSAKIKSPPVFISKIAPLRFITKVTTVKPPPKSERYDASLVPKKSGFHVFVNAEHARHRQRFSVAHEIIHTFFYDITSMPPTRPFGLEAFGKSEENICNLGAAEILVPSEILQHYVQGFAHSPDSLAQLGAIFQVSKQVIAKRLIELNLWDATIICYRWMSEEKTNKPSALRIDWFASKDYWIPFTDSADDEMIIKTFQTGLNNSGFTELDVGNLRGRYFLNCYRYGESVLCVITKAAPRDHQELQNMVLF